jgi:hypothetical protein
MPTTKQKRAVANIVENRGNVSRAMRDAGYDSTTAKNPKNLTESKGYNELLKECGLTQSYVLKALVEDIKKKPQHRFQELSLAADLLGMKKSAQIEITQQQNTLNLLKSSQYNSFDELSTEELNRILNEGKYPEPFS